MTTWNHAVVTAAHIHRQRKARVQLYFAYLEGDSLTFPHPCVLRDHVLLSIHEKLWRRASRSKVSPKMAPFLLVGIQYTQIFIDAPVYFVFLLATSAKGWNWYNRRIIWPAFLEFWHTAHFVRASVIFSGKTVHTNSLWLFVVGFHFYFLTVVRT